MQKLCSNKFFIHFSYCQIARVMKSYYSSSSLTKMFSTLSFLLLFQPISSLSPFHFSPQSIPILRALFLVWGGAIFSSISTWGGAQSRLGVEHRFRPGVGPFLCRSRLGVESFLR